MIDVDEIVAVEAHQVVVGPGARIEPGSAAGVARLGDDSHAGQMLERAVDRSAGDSGFAFRDRGEHLIGRGVVVEVEDRLENDPPLHRTPFAPLTAPASELLYSSFFFRNFQTLFPEAK